MSFATLSKRGRGRSLDSHVKQASFDVSELAAVGRVAKHTEVMPTSHSTSRLSSFTPLRKFTQFFKRMTSEPGETTHNQSTSDCSIFGRSLGEICLPEPPKPITDLLTFLQEVGPLTKEIFRKPPNARKCKLLGEKLNSANFYWDVKESCDGLLLGAVLKSFLREIPNKLCDDRLYNHWAAIINDADDNHERKVEQIKRMLYRLPQANQLLLRHLVCALYKIQQNSAENLMTISNLSICLGPCLLWTKSTNSKDIEKASKTVPHLIEFIIKHCIEIFGRTMAMILSTDDSGLLRNTSLSMDSIFSEKPCCKFVDSSCQSINRLNDQICRRLKSPSHLSYDSGLILDDASHDGDINVDTKTSTLKHQRFNLSLDSLDCQGYVSSEDTIKYNNNNSVYENTKDLIPSVNSSKDAENGYHKCTDYHRQPEKLSKTMNKDSKATLMQKRNTVNIPRRRTRPSILPEESMTRKPSVMYDKVVYRYISDPASTPVMSTPTGTFYSLPRPPRRSKASNILPDSSHSGPQLAPITCGQSKWRCEEEPMIVTDTIDCGTSSQVHNKALRDLSTVYLPRTKSLQPPPIYQNVNTICQVDAPIYENSEIYEQIESKAPAASVSKQCPVYENLTYHRRPPAVQIRRRTFSSGNRNQVPVQAPVPPVTRHVNKSTPKTDKQKYFTTTDTVDSKKQVRHTTTGENLLKDVNKGPGTIYNTRIRDATSRKSNFNHSTHRKTSNCNESRQLLHETCYFV